MKKRGSPKKAKEKQRETLKNKQKMLFSRGENKVFLYYKAKTGKEQQQSKKNKKNK